MIIGASGCKAVCGALEQNTAVVAWWHISTWIVQCCCVCSCLGEWGGGIGGWEGVGVGNCASAVYSLPFRRWAVTRFGLCR